LTDSEAVRLTGPGLFPQLIAVRTQMLHDATSNRQIARNTVVMQELSQGLSYQMRVSRPAGNQWVADQYFVFVSPVCQSSF
jgi:predicted pyridoxine 5'-phosphate oxidase superfamily flavin-nucleotide-binding protein